MTLNTLSLVLLAKTSLTPFLAVHAQTSVSSIQPAATVVPSQSAAGAPYFTAETVQLTEDALQHSGVGKVYEYLFAFDNGTGNPSLPQSGDCKVMPGQSAWPTDQVWDTFDKALRRALIKTIPVAAPCHKSSFGVYDPAKCSEIVGQWSTSELHTSDPTSMMWPIFQGRTCMPTTTNPNSSCTLGGYPSYVVNVSTVAQIQLGVNFARNANLRLVIKNTGHDYIGKSSGAGALSIWTHHLKDIAFLPDYKIINYTGNALKVGAGVDVRDLYIAANKYGVTALGGICPSVGVAGGYIAGGGHSPLSSLWGMAADQILALEVVTADGRFLTASPTLNPDLFWALRGGGGSTFGIVTSLILKVYPKIPITISQFSFAPSANVSTEAFWAGLRALWDYSTRFTDAGAYLYFWIWNTGGEYRFDMQPFFAPNMTVEAFNQLIQPWFDQLHELGIPLTPNTTYYTNFWDAVQASMGDETIGAAFIRQGSRLFPRANFEDSVKLNATFAAVRHTVESGYSITGYHIAPRNPQNVNNAVNTAWRTAQSHLITATMVQDAENTTAAEVKAASNTLTYDVLAPWREVAPNSAGGGAYLNEADIQEPDWQATFYGSNYPELYRLKQKWDPRGVFYATTGVGSENWMVQDGDQGVQTQNGPLCRV